MIARHDSFMTQIALKRVGSFDTFPQWSRVASELWRTIWRLIAVYYSSNMLVMFLVFWQVDLLDKFNRIYISTQINLISETIYAETLIYLWDRANHNIFGRKIERNYVCSRQYVHYIFTGIFSVKSKYVMWRILNISEALWMFQELR